MTTSTASRPECDITDELLPSVDSVVHRACERSVARSGATLFCMERERATFKMARSGAWPCQGRGPHFAPRTLFPRLHSLHSGEHSLGVSLIMISLPVSDQPFSQSRKGLAERRSERPTRQSLRLRYRSDVAGGSGARGGGE